MALKKKITQEAFDKLSDTVKSEYKKNGDNYILDVEDDDDGELRRAHDRVKREVKEAKEKADKLQDELDEIKTSGAIKNGDVKTLEASWKEKLATQKTESQGKLDKANSFIEKHLGENVALGLATKLNPNKTVVLLPHVKARIKVDMSGDEPVTRVLDKDGKVSAMSIDDLHAEFVANKDFSGIIEASKASGGGAGPGSSKQQQGGAQQQGTQPLNLANANPADVAAHIASLKTQ